MPTMDETRQALTEQRRRLKVKLWRWRARRVAVSWQRELWRPRCDYCDEPIFRADDCTMHEWLIKRNAIPVSLQFKIMAEENCILAHRSCHEQHGQTRKFKLRCARTQYKRYGREAIVAWVESLGLKQHVEIPTEEEVKC